MNLRKRQPESKKEVSEEAAPVSEPPSKMLPEPKPEPKIEAETKREVEQRAREKLPPVNPPAAAHGAYPPRLYEAPRPPVRADNPLLIPNAQLNYVLYNPLYVRNPVPDAFTPHFQQSPPDIPRPIFNHCAIHAGIAYFIQAIQKREAILSL
eukprot:TRINITY_DN3762_c0_g1_i1.p1 TRINITY_DN3762_c0_g1~~TRINITY_DN3762_c0_g1_i1.p1  ORF type:complete len:152 (-),score=43.89 TRINITY_DN3762_c0_g1_i1:326-781(-)